MIRIGIVGTDNSHSIAFSKLLNVKESRDRRVRGARVTHVFGLEAERNQEVAKAGQIPHLVDKPEEMIDHVDGVIVDLRHGSRHLRYARPFLKAGVPTFVDKPLAHTGADAKKILRLAAANDTPICSFSTVPFAEDVAEYIAGLRADAGELTGGVYTGPADRTSEYDGLIFYGIHIADLMVEIHGTDVRAVNAVESAGNIIATVRYADGALAALHFVGRGSTRFRMTTVGTRETRSLVMAGSAGYLFGMMKFIKMIKTGESPRTYDQMLVPVQVIDAVVKSLERQAPVRVRPGL